MPYPCNTHYSYDRTLHICDQLCCYEACSDKQSGAANEKRRVLSGVSCDQSKGRCINAVSKLFRLSALLRMCGVIRSMVVQEVVISETCITEKLALKG